MLNRLDTVFKEFSKWCHHLGTTVVLPVMVIIITANVVMRYFFNAPLPWGEEINGLLLFLVLFLSMTYTWDQKKHIRMELVYVHLKGRWRALSDIVTAVTGIIFFGLLALQAVFDIEYMIKTNETGEELHFPLWPFRALAAAIAAVFVLKLIFYVIRGRHEEGEAVTEVEGVVIKKMNDHVHGQQAEKEVMADVDGDVSPLQTGLARTRSIGSAVLAETEGNVAQREKE